MAKPSSAQSFSVQVDEVTFRDDVQKIRARLSDVQLKALPVSRKAALNKTGTQVVKRTLQKLSSAKKVPQRAIKPRVSVTQKATAKRASVIVRGRFHALAYSELGTLSDTPSGVRVRGQGVIPGLSGNKTFVATVSARGKSHTGAFSRKGARRLPISERKLPLLPEGRTILTAEAGDPARVFFVAAFEADLQKRIKARGL